MEKTGVLILCAFGTSPGPWPIPDGGVPVLSPNLGRERVKAVALCDTGQDTAHL